jgi:hypothetical protein
MISKFDAASKKRLEMSQRAASNEVLLQLLMEEKQDIPVKLQLLRFCQSYEAHKFSHWALQMRDFMEIQLQYHQQCVSKLMEIEQPLHRVRPAFFFFFFPLDPVVQ